MRRVMRTIIAVMAAAVIFSTSAFAAEKSYIILFPLATGLSIGSTGQMVKDIGKAVKKRTGLPIDMKEFRYTRDIDVAKTLAAKAKKGEYDFVIMSARDYIRIESTDKGLLVPDVTITFFGKPTTNVCLYTRKADGVKSLADLKGKKWGGTSMIPMKYMLYKNGIKTPMKQFFSKQVFIIDENVSNVMNALLDKKIDAFALQSLQYDMAKGGDKRYTEIQASNCMEYEHSWLFAYKKGTPPDVVEKVRNIMINAHKDKEFQQFKFLFTAIKGHFVKFDPANLAVTKDIFNLMNKNGWEKEDQAFIKAGMKNVK